MSLHRAVEAIRAARSELQYDDLEISRLYPPTDWWMPILVHESPQGLFQISFGLQGKEDDELYVFMRFAYCNPRSVYVPFCEVAALLMRMFDLQCLCDEDYPEEMKDAPHVIENSDWLLDILAPSMDLNKSYWHSDAETTEEAILRPGDAVARFIVPQLTPATE